MPNLVSLTDRDQPQSGPTMLSLDGETHVPSFDGVYQREYSQLLGLGFVLTGNRSIAEDLVQDTFAEAHKRWAIVSTYDNLGAWLRRVLVNKSTSRGRRLVSEAKMLRVFGARHSPSVDIPEHTGEIWKAVRALPRRQAQTVALFYWEDRPIAEIAEILECGEATVKTHLKRARSTLAANLDSHATEAMDEEDSR